MSFLGRFLGRFDTRKRLERENRILRLRLKNRELQAKLEEVKR